MAELSSHKKPEGDVVIPQKIKDYISLCADVDLESLIQACQDEIKRRGNNRS